MSVRRDVSSSSSSARYLTLPLRYVFFCVAPLLLLTLFSVISSTYALKARISSPVILFRLSFSLPHAAASHLLRPPLLFSFQIRMRKRRNIQTASRNMHHTNHIEHHASRNTKFTRIAKIHSTRITQHASHNSIRGATRIAN